MPHLLHFSEDPDIAVFRPHVPASSPHNPPLVWAVDEAHAPGFWFPRAAPRACCWSGGKPLTPVGQALLGLGAGQRMHAIESVWLERLRACRMHVYRFDAAPFALYNESAGYYAARETVRPLSVAPVGDLLALHAAAGIELRFVPNLWPLIDAIVASGLEFSIIRKMNALPRAAST
ncbi:MAG TPA: hypothetical protein VNU97_12175 [Rhizomicrobium sp.]|jgi:hypothetical protein|nr:hypothetical protein [Rhizomicrobium sp.]